MLVPSEIKYYCRRIKMRHMEAAFNYYYDIYPNILPATAMGFAVISGRIAAENALQYIKSINK